MQAQAKMPIQSFYVHKKVLQVMDKKIIESCSKIHKNT